MSNQVLLKEELFSITNAQKLVLRTYKRLCEEQAPRDFSACIKHTGENLLYSMILSGEETLVKQAILSGIKAYTKLGLALKDSPYTRMNLISQIDVLERVEGFPQDICRTARDSGHRTLMVMARKG